MDATSENNDASEVQDQDTAGAGGMVWPVVGIAITSATGPKVYAAAVWWRDGKDADWLMAGLHAAGLFTASALAIAVMLLALKKIVERFGK